MFLKHFELVEGLEEEFRTKKKTFFTSNNTTCYSEKSQMLT